MQSVYFAWSPCVILYLKRGHSKRKTHVVTVFINTSFWGFESSEVTCYSFRERLKMTVLVAVENHGYEAAPSGTILVICHSVQNV
jgi:hypothetical protein